MPDKLIRCISKKGNIRAFACQTNITAQFACKRHQPSITASAALCRALTGAVLMGATMEKTQRIGLKFEGNGPLERIMVEADGSGRVRGFVANPKVEVPPLHGKLDIPGAIGKAGMLTVVKDIGLKEKYTGHVNLVSSQIAEDIAYYLVESEQIPSAMALGVHFDVSTKVKAAGGYLIQSLPPSNPKDIEAIIKNIENMPSLTQLLRDGKTPEEILEFVLSDVPFDKLSENQVRYMCPCTREFFERGLISLGVKQLTSLKSEQRETEVVCEYCKSPYVFTTEDLDNLISEAQNSKKKK